MDYIEAFRNLKSNQKYSKKSPHKAILLLTIIKLYETNILIDNEIPYDESLLNTFKLEWNKVLPGESLFHPDAYLPYWYMQSEDFWHVVPKRGKEDILNLMRDENVKPSESKLKDCVKYAELDEDLYFLMTIPSGRSSMKRALLETYTSLSAYKINKLSDSPDNSVDNSIEALSDFQKILTSSPRNEGTSNITHDIDSVNRFHNLNDDIQISLYLSYYTFLKRNRHERELLRSYCSDVFELYDRLTIKPVKPSDIDSSFKSSYRDFLMDIKISLMSENGSMSLIDNIDHALDSLEGNEPFIISDTQQQEENIQEDVVVEDVNLDIKGEELVEYSTTTDELPELKPAIESRNGKRWTEDELINLQFYFEKGYTFDSIATALGRSEVSIKSKLNALGLIEYDYEAERLKKLAEEVNKTTKEEVITQDELFAENTSSRCYLYNKQNEKVYSSSGKIKIFNGVPYRLAYAYSHFSVNVIEKSVFDKYITGPRIINASAKSTLFYSLPETGYLDLVDEIREIDSSFIIKVGDQWFNSEGEISSYKDSTLQQSAIEPQKTESLQEKEEEFTYVPKGKIAMIKDIVQNTYDLLWMIAIVDLETVSNRRSSHTLDELACMMIAHAWTLMNKNPKAKEKETDLRECIEYLIEESKEYMDISLSWESSKDEVFDAIKDYPMAGVFEETVESLVYEAPFNILRAWYPEETDFEIITNSQNFTKPCLYAFFNKKIDPFITINKGWQGNIFYDHDKLLKYFVIEYNKFVEGI